MESSVATRPCAEDQMWRFLVAEADQAGQSEYFAAPDREARLPQRSTDKIFNPDERFQSSNLIRVNRRRPFRQASPNDGLDDLVCVLRR